MSNHKKGKLTYLAYDTEEVPGVRTYQPIYDHDYIEMPTEFLESLIKQHTEQENFEVCAEIKKVIDSRKDER